MRPGPAVIFDFDGVIADSESQHFRAFQQAFTEHGWTLSEADYYERYLGYSDREVFALVASERGEPLPSTELELLIASKGRAYADLLTTGAARERNASFDAWSKCFRSR